MISFLLEVSDPGDPSTFPSSSDSDEDESSTSDTYSSSSASTGAELSSSSDTRVRKRRHTHIDVYLCCALKKFDGSNVQNFLSFWTSFKNIVQSNRRLTSSEKLAYQKSFLGKEALALVAFFPFEGAFYKPSRLKAIHQSCGRTRVIIEDIVHKFSNINASDNAKALQHLFHEASSTILSLKSLKRDVHKMGDVFIFI